MTRYGLTNAEMLDVWREIRHAMREFIGILFSGSRFADGIRVPTDLRKLLERRALKAMGYPPPYWKLFEPPPSTLSVVADWLPRGCVG